MKKAVIGFGSNLGNREENISIALDALRRLPGTTVISKSRLYETKPFDVKSPQNDYLNGVVMVLTDFSPKVLLGACLGIETGMGRVRKEYHGPRVIDLDLLVYENAECSDFELTLPHPGVLQRAFVLAPLADLFPGKVALGLDFSAAYARMDITEIKEF